MDIQGVIEWVGMGFTIPSQVILGAEPMGST